MTSEEKARLTALRNEGFGYKRIAQELRISVNSVKTFCRRNGLASAAKKEEPAADRRSEQRCTLCENMCGIRIKEQLEKGSDKKGYRNSNIIGTFF